MPDQTTTSPSGFTSSPPPAKPANDHLLSALHPSAICRVVPHSWIDLISSTMEPEQPWHAAFPAPKTTEPASLTREQVLEKLRAGGIGREFILVDVRRNDYEGGTVRGSINLPAQSLFPTIPTLYQLFKGAGVRYIIWYCGSSRGRGTRAAGWFNDYIQEQGDEDMKSVILTGGIKGWANAGKDFVELMDGYVPEYWAQFRS